MTEKDKLIARLNELGKQLERSVSTSGTIPELTMRIAELEEELNDDGQDSADDNAGADAEGADSNAQQPEKQDVVQDHADGDDNQETDSNTQQPQQPENHDDLVKVETRVTLHIDALHVTRNERVSIAEPGTTIRVSGKVADDLSARKLVRKH